MSGSTLKQGPRGVMEDKFVTQTYANSLKQEWFLTTVKEKKYSVIQQKSYFFVQRFVLPRYCISNIKHR